MKITNKKPRPAPLQALRQAPAATRSDNNTEDKFATEDKFPDSYNVSLRPRASVETRCSTLKSDILNYYLHAGDESPNKPVPLQPVLRTANDASAADKGELVGSNGSQSIAGACLRTMEPSRSDPEWPDSAISGFDFAFDNDEAISSGNVQEQRSLRAKCLSFELSPPRSTSQINPVSPPPTTCLLPLSPAVSTPNYSLFPAITTPPQVINGIILPNRSSTSTGHTRNASSSSSIQYALPPSNTSPIPADNISSPPQRPRVARVRSSTLTSNHSNPSTASNSTIRPLFNSNSRKSSLSRWSNDNATRPLLSRTASRAVSFSTCPAATTTMHIRTDSSSSRTFFLTSPSSSAAPTRVGSMMTPHGSVTTSYISSNKKRLSRPPITPATFDPVPVSVFDDDESEVETTRWGRLRGRSWGSFGSAREVRGNEFRLLDHRRGAVRHGEYGSRKTRRWSMGCCGLL